jgi:hypothetical protein
MKRPRLADYRLPQATDALNGCLIELTVDGGGHLALQFDGQSVEWQASALAWADKGRDACDVVELRPGVYFVDVDFAGRPLEALTLVFSRSSGRALVVHQERHPGANPAVAQSFHAALVDRTTPSGEMPGPTAELNGRWHLLRYSSVNLYEHIYVSTTRMGAHNLATENTAGRAEFHDATYWRFEDGLYVIGWRERDSEAAMVVCEDVKTLRSTGKVLHPVSAERSDNAPIGGHILPVRVHFPEGVEFDRP